MTTATRPRAALSLAPPQPADLVRRWAPLVKEIDADAEIDFSFSRDAITICDMRAPAALRYADLFTRAELDRGVYKTDGEIARRVREFMR